MTFMIPQQMVCRLLKFLMGEGLRIIRGHENVRLPLWQKCSLSLMTSDQLKVLPTSLVTDSCLELAVRIFGMAKGNTIELGLVFGAVG